jgi:hypothetical protein
MQLQLEFASRFVPRFFAEFFSFTHLSIKEASLLCFVLYCSYEIHQTGMLQIVFFGLFGKLLMMRRGAWAWFHDIWTCSAKGLEY